MTTEWTYELRYVVCGKPNCAKCGIWNRVGHGPYWYGYRRENGKVKSKYFGKKDPRYVSKPPPQPPRAPDRWYHPKRMDYNAALRIMGFTSQPSRLELKARYRSLLSEHHPDHGGSNDITVAINLANSYLLL